MLFFENLLMALMYIYKYCGASRRSKSMNINPELDLYFERIVDVPPELIWKAWTVPEHMLPWFCPLPWKTVEVELDLRPGGKFYTVMQSPEG